MRQEQQVLLAECTPIHIHMIHGSTRAIYLLVLLSGNMALIVGFIYLASETCISTWYAHLLHHDQNLSWCHCICNSRTLFYGTTACDSDKRSIVQKNPHHPHPSELILVLLHKRYTSRECVSHNGVLHSPARLTQLQYIFDLPEVSNGSDCINVSRLYDAC